MLSTTPNNIAGNLKYLRKKKGLTQLQARTRFGFTRSTWSNYENGPTTPAIDDLIRFSRFFAVSLDDLILKDLGKTASGSIVIVDDKPELIVEPIYGPFLGQAEGLVEITSESMEPTFKKGSRIAINRLKDFRQLVWGDCYYVINKSWQGFVRRLYEGENDTYIRLLSDHPDQEKYPPIKLELEKIEAICQIRAEIICH